jgi:hypothetical protein
VDETDFLGHHRRPDCNGQLFGVFVEMKGDLVAPILQIAEDRIAERSGGGGERALGLDCHHTAVPFEDRYEVSKVLCVPLEVRLIVAVGLAWILARLWSGPAARAISLTCAPIGSMCMPIENSSTASPEESPLGEASSIGLVTATSGPNRSNRSWVYWLI